MRDNLVLTVIGSGSIYTPELAQGLITRRDVLPIGELRLMDIDRRKLDIVGGLVQRMVAKAGLPTRVVLTEDRRESIRGADYVVVQARVGRLAGRIHDERIPAELGLIGQETNGAGGFAMAMRTMPLLRGVVEEVLELAPQAFIVNFMNPSGLITEGAVRHWERLTGKDARVDNPPIIGLCNIPIKMKKYLAERLGVDDRAIDLRYLGLNHMSFVTGAYVGGRDVLPDVISGLGPEEMLDGTGFLPDAGLIKLLGFMPNQYLKYYYTTAEMLQEQQRSPKTRGEVVAGIEEELLELYARQELAEKPKQLEQRGGAWYSEAAVSLIDALHNNRREVHVVNVPNRGAVAGLPDHAIVEVPSVIGSAGATPLAQGRLPQATRGLVQTIKEYEQLTILAS